jgi:hypothetical protein
MMNLSVFFLASFLPPNDLQIPISGINVGGITEKEFNDVQTELSRIYIPIARSKGGNLMFRSDWKSSTVNAFAQRFGHENEDGEEMPPFDDWRVVFLGGLARHKYMTRDGFSLVVCHELGHHLGGSPTYDGETSWASAEGQADYFATTKCLRKLWENEDNEAKLSDVKIPETLKASCEKQWTQKRDVALCLRQGLAGLQVGMLFADIGSFQKLPKFETPDLTQVKKTMMIHPKSQCRLDTYFQGSLCEVSFNEEFGQDEVAGACHMRSAHKTGLRPACWYLSK